MSGIDAYKHHDVIKRKHFPRKWPFVRGIHRWPVNSPNRVQWRGALVFSLICALTNGWVYNRDAGGLRQYRAHYDVNVMNLRAVYMMVDGTVCSWEQTICNHSYTCLYLIFLLILLSLATMKSHCVFDRITHNPNVYSITSSPLIHNKI